MKRMFLVLLFFWMVGGSSVMAAVEACSADGITKLKHDGWTIEEIKSLCANNSGAKSAVQPQVGAGQRCSTKLGVCNLFHTEPVPVGFPCYCNNPNTGRPDHGQIIH